jgi:hypothetical protein
MNLSFVGTRSGLLAIVATISTWVSMPVRATSPSSRLGMASDPSDITQSSYASPLRGDVIEWKPSLPSRSRPVLFAMGSAVLLTEVRDELRTLVAELRRDISFEVIGCSDEGGKPGLASARALAIQRALVSAGVPAGRIRMMTDALASAATETHESALGHGFKVPVVSEVRWQESPRSSVSEPAVASRSIIKDQAHQISGMGASAAAVSAIPNETAASSTVVNVPVGTTAAPIAPRANAVPTWEVRTQDVTLEKTLERWAAAAGYRLRWDAARNFLIAAPDRYEGSFESALLAVLGSPGIRHSDYPLEACIYANKPPLVRVTRQGEQAPECITP